MDLLEYRKSFLNDIKVTATEEERYPYAVFIDEVSELMINEWSLLSSIEQCPYSEPKGTRAFKSMLIHAGSLDVPMNTINLLYADFDENEEETITNSDIKSHTSKMINFVENALKDYFADGEQSNPAVQLGLDIKRQRADIYKIHLFIISTNKINKSVKSIGLDDMEVDGQTYKVELDVIDIEKIFNAQLATSVREDVVINVCDFGISGIPCIRANINAGSHEAYLAVVPGEFLSEIYKKYGPRLLEKNVRSFLQLRGGVNKGIRQTIINERENFFSYNNGISTTAKSIKLEEIAGIGQCITSFTDFQIINGGQTTASLASASIKNKAPLDKIFVQMKLSVILEEGEVGDEFIRKISEFANSQNKVTAADLVSNHPFYQRIEGFSRKIYAPAAKGVPYQTRWFFERSRGQYEQPKMKMTKAECATYDRTNPKKQKFDKKDLAKYMNSADMRPYDVAWGGEINSVRFQRDMAKQWESDKSEFNESYFRDLVAKAIVFNGIRKAILKNEQYQESPGYLIQTTTYAFSKLMHEIQKLALFMDYKFIWDKQDMPDFLLNDAVEIALSVREVLFTPGIGNVESYCKKKECWEKISSISYNLSDSTKAFLLSKDEIRGEKKVAQKEQKFVDGISVELEVFKLGADYWQNLCKTAQDQNVISSGEIQLLQLAVQYCSGSRNLPQSHFKRIIEVREKIREAQIPV